MKNPNSEEGQFTLFDLHTGMITGNPTMHPQHTVGQPDGVDEGKWDREIWYYPDGQRTLRPFVVEQIEYTVPLSVGVLIIPVPVNTIVSKWVVKYDERRKRNRDMLEHMLITDSLLEVQLLGIGKFDLILTPPLPFRETTITITVIENVF